MGPVGTGAGVRKITSFFHTVLKEARYVFTCLELFHLDFSFKTSEGMEETNK